ncbi:Uma2 family endonuclease [Caldilinea sp.]|uniref:Uma2 family endonuclease n=1 Tax=Caldilinea sp. TaxID=2293560 RepID=UPI002BDD1C2C|nr:Uma2 family endonuclease [Anaerolineales bacterium]HQY92272.1 Uma2 family endonuclease [Caldilinea sp.]HRA64796.1 Uma2 family endonuclease [Caldilinea sp.]
MVTPIYTLFDTPVKARMSATDYIASPQSEHKSDLIEGVFVMASPASFGHEDVMMFFGALLRLFVNQRQLGVVLGSNAAYRLNDANVYQPDVSFLSTGRLYLAGEVYVNGAPDLAVEIISPSSRQYDSVEKLVNYGRFGVQEYWLVDPLQRTITLYGNVGGQLVVIPPADSVLRSRLLPGFWLRPEWVFPSEGQVRPGELEIARQQGLI